jgi:hypothetical protein
MSSRRLSSFIDALAIGRRPSPFRADPEDVEMLRIAIALRAARPGNAIPDEKFVSDLHQELTEQASSLASPDETVPSNVHPIRIRRVRTAMVAVAASIALIGGTFLATEASTHGSVGTSALQVPHGKALRTASFVTSDGRVLGQIVVDRGHPSWVFMNVNVPSLYGSVKCKLRLDNGSIVAAGTVALHNGRGELGKRISVDTGHLRGAMLFNSNGAVLASATFA